MMFLYRCMEAMRLDHLLTYLHYNEARDLVYCHTCLRAFAEKRIKAANADAAFVSVLANHEIK